MADQVKDGVVIDAPLHDCVDLQALREAGVQQLDYMVVTHYDTDHVENVAQYVLSLSDSGHDPVKAQLGRDEGVFLVALVGEEIVATASARQERDGAALLTRLYVLPNRQGVGIGRTLLQVALACFPEAPVARLEVESQNEPAIAFYERMGFFLQRQARFDGRDDTPNTLLMAKRLFVA